MANPYKPEDKVQTKVKGTIVDAVVRLVWNDEVQVRTNDKALLWRTVKTVWYPGAQAQAEPPSDTTTSGKVTQPSADESGAHSSATPTADAAINPAPAPADVPTPAPDHTEPDSAPIANADLPQSGVVQPSQGLTACSGGDTPVAKRKMRRKKK